MSCNPSPYEEESTPYAGENGPTPKPLPYSGLNTPYASASVGRPAKIDPYAVQSTKYAKTGPVYANIGPRYGTLAVELAQIPSPYRKLCFGDHGEGIVKLFEDGSVFLMQDGSEYIFNL